MYLHYNIYVLKSEISNLLIAQFSLKNQNLNEISPKPLISKVITKTSGHKKRDFYGGMYYIYIICIVLEWFIVMRNI